MPSAAPSKCSKPGCFTLIIRRAGGLYLCDKHRREKHQRIDAGRGTPEERGYGSGWEALRVQAFLRDGWRCVACGWEPVLVGIYRKGGLGVPPTSAVLKILRGRKNAREQHLHADHVVPIGVDPSRRLDLSNVQTLCNRCHSAKTLREGRLCAELPT